MEKPSFPVLTSAEKFFFDTPLYVQSSVDLGRARELYGHGDAPTRIDGHCPDCGKTSTFTAKRLTATSEFEKIETRHAFDETVLSCGRNESHKLRYFWLIRRMVVLKVGQFPSLATITNNELAEYRKHMSREDAAEFYKAVGLGAHDVHIGAFVYLRRVFERIIYKRFDEFKGAEGWSEGEFYKLKMAEKVAFLKDHLPAFLVDDAKVYRLLSMGLHTLTEEQCGAFFHVIKDSIVVILEDDIKKKDELARRAHLAKAIASVRMDDFSGTDDTEEGAS